MSDEKVQPTHLQCAAFVYVRQSSAAQVEHQRESTRRQYDLAERARKLGWRADQVTVIDEDLGLSGATTQGRGGFARMLTWRYTISMPSTLGPTRAGRVQRPTCRRPPP